MKLTFNTEALRKAILACQFSIRGEQATLGGEGSGKTLEVDAYSVSFSNQSGKVQFQVDSEVSDLDKGTKDEWLENKLKFSFPLKQLLVACQACSVPEISFDLKESWARVIGGSSRMRIPFQKTPIEDAGAAQGEKTFTSVRVTLGKLEKSLEAASIAQGRDDQAGWRLDAIEIAIEDSSVSVFSCDGNRISLSRFKVDGKKTKKETKEVKLKSLIPKSCTPGLLWYLGKRKEKEVTVSFFENQLHFESNDSSLNLRTCAGRLPDVSKILIEEECKTYIELFPETLTPIVDRAILFSQDGMTIQVIIGSEDSLPDEVGTMTISSSSSKLGEYSESVSLGEVWDRDSLSFNVNGKVFSDFLRGCNEEVGGIMELSPDDNRPIFIRANSKEVDTLYIMAKTV